MYHRASQNLPGVEPLVIPLLAETVFQTSVRREGAELRFDVRRRAVDKHGAR